MLITEASIVAPPLLRAALEDDVLREIMNDEYELVIGKWGVPKIGYGNTNQPLLAKRFDVSRVRVRVRKPEVVLEAPAEHTAAIVERVRR